MTFKAFLFHSPSYFPFLRFHYKDELFSKFLKYIWMLIIIINNF
jgi:hypothetical protein